MSRTTKMGQAIRIISCCFVGRGAKPALKQPLLGAKGHLQECHLGHFFLAGPPGILPLQHIALVKEH